MESKIIFVALAALGASAQADMRWKTEIRLSAGRGGAAPTTSVVTTVKEGAQRKETSLQMAGMAMNTVSVTLCDKKQKLKIDDKLKIYATLPADADDSPAGAMGGVLDAIKGALPPGIRLPNIPGLPAQPPAGEPQTGKVVTTITVQDMGEETVAEVVCRHWTITMLNEPTGCAGNAAQSMKMEVWTANLTEPIVCPNSTTRNPLGDYQRATRPNCNVTTEMKGDGIEAYQRIFRGLTMRMKMFTDLRAKEPVMTEEVTMLTRARQDEALFAAPAGYRQVTGEEFGRLQSEALMKEMFRN